MSGITSKRIIFYFSIEKTEADSIEEDSDESVAEVKNRNRSKERIPEPENQVDFFIDDVLQLQ